MVGWRDQEGTLWTGFLAIVWKYEVGDWVLEPGLPNHHLRIIRQQIDQTGVAWYLIFDTSLKEGLSDFKWRLAQELEQSSVLHLRPHLDDIEDILKRAESCRYLLYSLLARTDCESLQRWIHSGNEDDRWSPQAWLGVGVGIFGAALLASAIQRSQ